MGRVLFDRASFNKCLCGGCPVQRDSACTIKKEDRLAGLKEDIQQRSKMPDPPSIFPGIYCSTAVGKSECNDLDASKPCLCPTCPVAFDSDLRNDYYCTLMGSAGR